MTKIHLSKWTFDQKYFDQMGNLTKNILTKKYFDQNPIDQNPFDQKFFDQNGHLTKNILTKMDI